MTEPVRPRLVPAGTPVFEASGKPPLEDAGTGGGGGTAVFVGLAGAEVDALAGGVGAEVDFGGVLAFVGVGVGRCQVDGCGDGCGDGGVILTGGWEALGTPDGWNRTST